MLIHGSSPFAELATKDLVKMFDVNAVGAVRVTQSLLPALLKSERPIVANISSKMGSISDNTGGGHYGYRMSKAAMNMFNKSLAVDFPKLIAVCFHPGWVQTEMGGKAAPTSVGESVSGLGELIDKLEPKHSGRFFDFNGEELPW